MCVDVCVCVYVGRGVPRGMLLALRVAPYDNLLLMAVFMIIKFSLIPFIS